MASKFRPDAGREVFSCEAHLFSLFLFAVEDSEPLFGKKISASPPGLSHPQHSDEGILKSRRVESHCRSKALSLMY